MAQLTHALGSDIRSKLFVPGSRPDLFVKASRGEADALSFDLEDSVPKNQKEEARRAVSEFARHLNGNQGKVMIVRVNAAGDDLFQADIAAVVVAGVHVINLPKVESKEDVLDAIKIIETLERKASLETRIEVLANIETPKGLRCAYEIATSHPRMMGLQIGFVDMSRACGFEGANRHALDTVRMGVRLAASEAGIAAFDGAFVNVSDGEGFRAEAEEARSFGLNGKSCIHPSQVALANAVFSPSEEEIQHALRIVHAAAATTAGAFLLDGKMIDTPIVAQARGLVSRARRRGLANDEAEAQS